MARRDIFQKRLIISADALLKRLLSSFCQFSKNMCGKLNRKFLYIFSLLFLFNIYAEADIKIAQKKALEEEKRSQQLIPFSFVDRELTDIINSLASKKEVNVILPQGALAIKPENKITFKPTNSDMLTLSAAWNMLQTFLDLSGYAMAVQGDFYVITKNDTNIVREIFPLYINIPPRSLPNSEQRIRYVYYFTNLKINDPVIADNLKQILIAMLSPNRAVEFDPRSNGIIIIDRADVIKSCMNIIAELDSSGFKETIEVIQLFNSNVDDIKKVFDSLRSAIAADKTPFLRGDPKAELSTYFPAGTVIQTDPRRNLLIVMGRESAVTRIREFVTQQLDLPPESGASILHVYDLQYLNAQEFANVLRQVVSREGIGTQSAGVTGTGPERFFSGVIIAAETVVEVAKVESALGTQTVEKAQGVAGSVFSGGNRIVVAARKDDWLRIKKLIDALDKPKQQVIIEVFIVDLTDSDLRILGADLRNRLECGIDNGRNFLSSQLSAPTNVLPVSTTTVPVTSLASDLMKIITTPTLNGIIPILNPPNQQIGATLIAFNDPCSGISALLELLVNRTQAKVISRPHIVTVNNQLANIALTEIRRDRGEAFTSGGGVPTVPIVDINATIQVQIIPRISSPDRLALEVGIDINRFIGDVGADQITRRVATNANLNSGQVLVLGGLARQEDGDTETQTPILAKVPILGWFFKKEREEKVTTNLVVFIAPTIVQPKLRAGLHLYTEDKVRDGNVRTQYGTEEGHRDPVTRFYFNNRDKIDTTMKSYLSQSTNSPGLEEIKIDRKRVLPPAEKTGEKTEPSITETIPGTPVADKIKELLALEENPIAQESSVPKRKRKRVFNG